MNHARYILCVILLFSLQHVCYAEIYKWVDEKGVTHYSERKSGTTDAEEISDKLGDKGNIIEFKKTKPFEFYKSKKTAGPTRLNIVIDLINYELSPELRRRIENNVNGIYKIYVTRFGWNPQPLQPITIRIFGKYKDFEDYQIKNRGRAVSNRSHYSPRHKEVLMLGTEFTDATLGVLYHESSHAIMDMEMRYTPKWINEGLAEVFEHIRTVQGNVQIGYNAAWSEIVKHKLREGSLRPVDEYMNISNKQWHEESARVERTYYMVAWAMMRFLVTSQKGVIALRNTLVTCKRQACWNTGKLGDAFNRHYPGGLGVLDSDLRHWIKSLR